MNNQDKSRDLEVLARKIFDLGQTIGCKSAKNGPTSVDGIRGICSKEFSEAEDLIAAINAIGMVEFPDSEQLPWSKSEDRGGRHPC